MSSAYDAVVIGAGPNGLVTANLLADAGWSVLLAEQQDEVGGAVRSDSELVEGFVHDTFSAFYPFAAASPVLHALGLERHGLRWRHPPAPLAHPFPDGRWAMVLGDRHDTAAQHDDLHPGDGAAWLELCAWWDRIGPSLLGSLLTPFPPLRHGPGVVRALARRDVLAKVRELLTPAAELGADRFGGDAARTLIAGSAGHADIPLEAPGSGGFGLIMTMMAQTLGFPVPVGGAGCLSDALARRFEAAGGTLRVSTPVTRVEVEGGRAVAVHLGDAERVVVRRAVVADVSAPVLYGRLVDAEALPARVARGMRGFRRDPATVKVDWALSGPVPWASPPPVAPGSFHVADSLQDMQRSLAQVAAGAVPALPFLLAGQMTTTDPSRSPEGTESLWAYTHVPQGGEAATYDAGDGTITGEWGHDDRERMGDRIQARLEALAPGFSSRVLARRVLGPRELEARNASLLGGAVNGGTAQLHQLAVFRPVPGLGRAETGIRGLYLGSASAHPGGGVHGAPGANAARAALWHAHQPLRWARSRP